MTNIINSDDKMRDIKPMKEFDLTSSFNKILFLMTLFLCGWFAMYLWNTKRIYKPSSDPQKTFKNSDSDRATPPPLKFEFSAVLDSKNFLQKKQSQQLTKLIFK